MTPRTDAHIHLFDPGYLPDQIISEVDAYEQLRARHDIRAALVVGYEAEERFARNNAHILRLSAERRWIRPLAYVAASVPPIPGVLTQLLDRGFVGWATYLPESGPSLGEWPDAVVEELAFASGLLSINGTPAALARAEGVLGRLTTRPILISHLGCPAHAVASHGLAGLAPVLNLAQRPNILIKLSGLYAIDPVYPHVGAEDVVSAVVSAAGADRVVWGSDFTPALTCLSDEQLMVLPPWLASAFTVVELEQVLHETLDRLLGDHATDRTANHHAAAAPPP